MSHPDFKSSAEIISGIRKLADDLHRIRTESAELADEIGWPEKPLVGERMEQMQTMFEKDVTLTDQLSAAILDARESGILLQFHEFASAAEAGCP